MKRILFFIAFPLHVVCNADYATVALSQQSGDEIVVNTSAKFDNHGTNSTHTVYVPNPVTFSTRHRHFRHHTFTPHYNLDYMSTEQLAWYFFVNNYTEEDILSHPMLYMNQAYLAIAKQLPRYPEFVEKYYNKYSTYKGLYAVWKIINFRYRDGMREKFAELYQECQDQRFKERARKRREREERAKKEAALVYYTKLESITHDELMIDAIPHQHQQDRNKTQMYIKTTSDRGTRQYAVTQDAITFAHTYGIIEHDLTSLQGNAYEQQLHTEFLEQLTEACTISTSYALQPKNILIDAVGHGAALGMEANRLQQPETATAWANLGWKVLDIIEGVGEGLVLFAENTADMLLHPKHTLKQAVHSLGMLTGLVARTCARAIGTASYWHELMEHGDGLLMAQEMDQVAQKAMAFGEYCIEKATSLEARNIAKYGTAITADIVLTHKMFVLSGTLCTRASPIIKDGMAHLGNRLSHIRDIMSNSIEIARAESSLLQTAEGICMKASEDLSRVGGTAMEVLKNTRIVLETMHAKYMAHLEIELGALRLLFDNKVKGFAEFANKFIKIEYKHILGMDLVFDAQGRAKFSGFHHDLMNTIEKSGAIEFANKVIHKNGFYGADLIIDGMKTPKTFFPSEWPREKVIEKIYEAYHNFIKCGVIPKPRPNEKYLISGTIEEGISIEMWVTKKGKVVTAYPLLK